MEQFKFKTTERDDKRLSKIVSYKYRMKANDTQKPSRKGWLNFFQ